MLFILFIIGQVFGQPFDPTAWNPDDGWDQIPEIQEPINFVQEFENTNFGQEDNPIIYPETPTQPQNKDANTYDVNLDGTTISHETDRWEVQIEKDYGSTQLSGTIWVIVGGGLSPSIPLGWVGPNIAIGDKVNIGGRYDPEMHSVTLYGNAGYYMRLLSKQPTPNPEPNPEPYPEPTPEPYPTPNPEPIPEPIPVNQPPSVLELIPNKESPQISGSAIDWTATASDPDRDDIINYKFMINNAATNSQWQDMTGWITTSTWTWSPNESDMGENYISVAVRDGNHAAEDDYDDFKQIAFTISQESNAEPKKPSIKIVGIDPVEGTTLTAGDSVEFKFTVEYDLGDNDYGKIKVAVDEFTTGYTDAERPVPDSQLDIGIGDTLTGSQVFTLTDTIGLDWSNVYVSADLYAAKKDEPLPATISAYDYKEYPLKADAAPFAEIRFEGTAREFRPGPANMPGSPTSWMVTVDKLISGPQPCTTPIEVVTDQSISPPIWGQVDKNVESGDKVEVYGSYVADNEGCRVTLHGSESYYFKKATCHGVIKGHVYDAQSKQPIKRASLECSLYCNEPRISDDQGYYELGSPACNICGLVYCSITCNADGYESEVLSLVTDIDGNGKKDLNFYLQPKKISRVVIQGEVIDRASCNQNDNRVSVLIKKVIEKPEDTMVIASGRTIDVRSKECALILDLLKGHCYEFQGSWIDESFWLQSNPLTTPVECTSEEENPEPSGCGKILYYAVSKGKHARGDTILGDMRYKSNVNGEADFSGTLLLRSPSGQVYSGLMHQRTPRYEEDSFGYGKGNSIAVILPPDAAFGLYAAKLELRRHDTDELCDETNWVEDQFEVEGTDKEKQPPFEEVKFKGTIIEHPDIRTGEDYYTVAVNSVLSGPKLNDQVDVCVASIFAKYPQWGNVDPDILETNIVEVFGRIDRTHSIDRTDITLNGREEYYLKKISGVGCEGEISGHVFDVETDLPIPDAQVSSSKRRHVGGLSQDDGFYSLSRACPNMQQMLYCQAEGYESGSSEATTDDKGNAAVDFHLKPRPGGCVQKDCQAQNQFEGQPTLKDGKFYMTYRDCKCRRDDCVCKTTEREVEGIIMGDVLDAKTGNPIDGATVCVIGKVCENCVRTDAVGRYILSPGQGQGGCSFQPNTAYDLKAIADCYQSSETTTVTTSSKGNAFQVNFKLQPKPKCKESNCDMWERPEGPQLTDKCGNVYQDYNAFECQRCDCINVGIEKRKVKDADNDPPWDPEILSSTRVSGKKLVPINIKFQSGDLEHDQIKYRINWDDGSFSETIFFDSDIIVSYWHTYAKGGNFEVTVTAEDECGGKSEHLCTIFVTIIG